MPTYLQIEVTLFDAEPRIWRRFLLREDANFDDLHHAIQDACGWEEDHPHEFRTPARGTLARLFNRGRGVAVRDESRAPISGCLEGDGTGRCLYRYDFGDGWEHDVEIRKVESSDVFERRLVDGARAFPPEDCGGIPGYERYCEFLATGEDPCGEDVEWVREWLGDWKPERFDLRKAKRAFDVDEIFERQDDGDAEPGEGFGFIDVAFPPGAGGRTRNRAPKARRKRHW